MGRGFLDQCQPGSHPVQAITVAVTYPCCAAIVTMPPPLEALITFLPELPADRLELQRCMALGRCDKVLITYHHMGTGTAC